MEAIPNNLHLRHSAGLMGSILSVLLVLGVTACGGGSGSKSSDPLDSVSETPEGGSLDGATEDPNDDILYKTGDDSLSGYVYYQVGDVSSACNSIYPFELAVDDDIAVFRERDGYGDYPISNDAFVVLIQDGALDDKCKFSLSNANKDVGISCIHSDESTCSDHFYAATDSASSGQLKETRFTTEATTTCDDFPDQVSVAISGNRAYLDGNTADPLVLTDYRAFRIDSMDLSGVSGTAYGTIDADGEVFSGSAVDDSGSCHFSATARVSTGGGEPPPEDNGLHCTEVMKMYYAPCRGK